MSKLTQDEMYIPNIDEIKTNTALAKTKREESLFQKARIFIGKEIQRYSDGGYNSCCVDIYHLNDKETSKKIAQELANRGYMVMNKYPDGFKISW